MSSEFRRHRITRIFDVDSSYSCFAGAADSLTDPLVLRACLWGLRHRYTILHVVVFVILNQVPIRLYMLLPGKYSQLQLVYYINSISTAQLEIWETRSVKPRFYRIFRGSLAGD
jgi:hypothetical protein